MRRRTRRIGCRTELEACPSVHPAKISCVYWPSIARPTLLVEAGDQRIVVAADALTSKQKERLAALAGLPVQRFLLSLRSDYPGRPMFHHIRLQKPDQAVLRALTNRRQLRARVVSLRGRSGRTMGRPSRRAQRRSRSAPGSPTAGPSRPRRPHPAPHPRSAG
jgi:hypothetical protein